MLRVEGAASITDVAGALYLADMQALAKLYGDAHWEASVGLDERGVTDAKAAAIARQADRAVRLADAAVSGRGGQRAAKAIAERIERDGFNGGNIDAYGPDGTIGRHLAGYLDQRFVEPAGRDDVQAMRAGVEAGMDWLAAAIGAGALHQSTKRALEDRVRGRIDFAEAKQRQEQERAAGERLKQQAQEAIASLPENAAPKEYGAAFRGVVDSLRSMATGLEGSALAQFVSGIARPVLDEAAAKIAEALAADIGPDKLPERITKAAANAKAATVAIGKLRADDQRELLRMINNAIEQAGDQLKTRMWIELDNAYTKIGKELQSLSDDADADAFESEAYRKIRAEVREKYRMMAVRQVAAEIGATAEELAAKQAELEAAVDGAKNAGFDAGEAIIAEVRAISGVSREQARQMAATMTERDPSAARLLQKQSGESMDDVLADFFQTVGGLAKDAGQAKIMSLAMAKKRYPNKLGNRRDVTRAACYRGDRYTITGGEDYNVVTLGTRSQGRQTLWHELGHWLENNNPLARAIVRKFVARRTDGEKPVRLSSIFPRCGYGRDEITLRDQFIHPYMGKVYDRGSTEILSMGLEYLAQPELAAKLAKEDPDMLSMLLKVIEVTNV